MHMVRDEVVEHEPDIEDIDSTLEQIDEQSRRYRSVKLKSPRRKR